MDRHSAPYLYGGLMHSIRLLRRPMQQQLRLPGSRVGCGTAFEAVASPVRLFPVHHQPVHFCALLPFESKSSGVSPHGQRCMPDSVLGCKRWLCTWATDHEWGAVQLTFILLQTNVLTPSLIDVTVRLVAGIVAALLTADLSVD